MRMTTSSTFMSTRYYNETRHPLSLGEALRIYFSILFGVAVSLMAFYYLFPQAH